MSSWDGYYNWDGILAATQPEYIRQRAAFLLDVADACSSVYKPEATGTYHEYYAVCLNHFGYTYDYYRNAVDNNTTIFALVDSVENGMPVLVSGYSGKEGHTFVVDGVDMTTSVRKWYSIDEDSFSSEDVTSIQSLKYHANLGWNGDQNGWYSPDAVTVKYKFPCEFIYLNIHPVK